MGLHALNRVYNFVRFRYKPLQKHRALAELSDVKNAREATGAWNVVNINIKNSNKNLSVVQEEIPLQDSNQSLLEDSAFTRSLRSRMAKPHF